MTGASDHDLLTQIATQMTDVRDDVHEVCQVVAKHGERLSGLEAKVYGASAAAPRAGLPKPVWWAVCILMALVLGGAIVVDMDRTAEIADVAAKVIPGG